ncbi:uncharacterized protein JCM6883_002354 [Sporobolomyces salmoneus]|uniref:uncharacterized protein n=1 Tax=Sporobolomyces salmoneus TaxID=183962 RepID=UPI0031707850
MTVGVWIVGYKKSGNGPKTDGIYADTSVLLSTLRRNPHLSSLVRNVNFHYAIFSTDDEDSLPPPLLPSELPQLLDELLQLLTLAKRLNFNLKQCYQAEMDEAVGRYQDAHQDNDTPSFRFSCWWERSDDVVLRGKYEGFEQNWHSNPSSSTLSLSSFLERSKTSLRDLTVNLDDDLDLRSFIHLERLRLLLPLDSSKMSVTATRVLSPLSSLRSLLLADFTHGGASIELLTTGKLASALPSRLTLLAVGYDCNDPSPAAALSLLRALPAASSLKMVNLFSDREEDVEGKGSIRKEDRLQWVDENDLVEEFSQKGIRLTLVEDWNW